MHRFYWHANDYLSETMGLTLSQHGIYCLLIMFCHRDEITPTYDQASELLWIKTPEARLDLDFVLKRYFTLEDDNTYTHKRTLDDLEIYKALTNKNTINGSKGGRPPGTTKTTSTTAKATPKKDSKPVSKSVKKASKINGETAVLEKSEKKPSGNPLETQINPVGYESVNLETQSVNLETQSQPTGNPLETLTKNQEPITKNNTPPTTPPSTDESGGLSEQKKKECVFEVFDYWKLKFGLKDATLDQKRKDVIGARLDDGYTTTQLKKSIDGVASSDYKMGKNSAGAKHIWLESIFKNADRVEKNIDLAKSAGGGNKHSGFQDLDYDRDATDLSQVEWLK